MKGGLTGDGWYTSGGEGSGVIKSSCSRGLGDYHEIHPAPLPRANMSQDIIVGSIYIDRCATADWQLNYPCILQLIVRL